MHRTPLHQFHLDHHANMVDFAGWEMPLTYYGLIEEHKQVRSSGGVFDVSHMGRLKITGRHARRFLERACSRSISDMQQGQCRYSLLCNDHGGVRDDVIVYRLDDDEFLMVVNASNREKVLAHFDTLKKAWDLALKIDDQTFDTAMVALQGPKVVDLIGKYSREIPTLKRYRFAVKNLMVAKLIVSRTGYTGEDGVEVILPSGVIGLAMKYLLQGIDMSQPGAALRPAGLGARDTLRTEAAMPLYGHELGEDINAFASGVDFAISLDKDKAERGEEFVGQAALRATKDAGGPPRKLAGFTLEGKRAARQGAIIRHNGQDVGVVTSGCPSPTLGVPIAMGFLDTALAAPDTRLDIDTGKGVLQAKVVPLPFYKAPK